MKYEILEITEEDYGCEGIPDDGELMCSVLVKDENNNKKWIKIPDRVLREKSLDTGSSACSEELCI